MAHFAEINENNEVLRVIVVSNADNIDAEGNEKEEIGAAFCNRLFDGAWKQTSYNNSFRKTFAGVGFTYNSSIDAFIPPKPYPSWIFDESIWCWQAPVSYPIDNKIYAWDENTQTWKAVDQQPTSL